MPLSNIQHNKGVKRGGEYHLLSEKGIVATATEVFGRDVVHGQSVDVRLQAVFQITNVADSSFVPVLNNPFEEPLSEGQFVIWDTVSVSPVEITETPHSKIRRIATDNYLKAANRQQINFDAKKANRTTSFSPSDTVGIHIHEVDRTNTDPKILPCKVLHVDSNHRDKSYKLYTSGGTLRQTFKSEDLVDLRNIHFPELQDVDIDSLMEISVIQASRLHTSWASKGTPVCTCKGNCSSVKCKCKRARVPCSTKCHRASVGSCRNKN